MMMKMVEPYIIIMSPGADDADAQRLGGRIDGAGDDRRARGEPGRARRLRRHVAGDVGRPQELAAAGRGR